MISVVELLTSGMYTTIQDKGRYGFAKYGVPKSGAMDFRSFFLANSILNNDKNSAVLEWTMIPPVLLFHEDTTISITGAVCDPFLNDVGCKMNNQLLVRKGDVLTLKNCTKGTYGFVGIKFGFQSRIVLGSRSLYHMITPLSFLQKGDKISYQKCCTVSTSNASVQVLDFWNKSEELQVYEGPEFELLSATQKEVLLSERFTISNDRNRMAISLIEPLTNDFSSMLSSPVLPGTVQLTPSGQLIVLMRDCQTTGGYPRVLQLTKDCINAIAQKRIGESIRFKIKTW